MNKSTNNSERPRVSTTNNSDCSYGTILREGTKILSDAAIPIMIGIVTLVIAIHQETVAQSNRDVEIVEAAEARKQDLNVASRQRVEDQELAGLQRLEDLSITRLQRELDLKIAKDQRAHANDISKKQRTLAEEFRTYEFNTARQNHWEDMILEDDRQKEAILAEYQDDLALIMLKNDFMLIRTNKTLLLALQLKTEAALRRLDPRRRTILIHYLLGAGFLDIELCSEQSLLFAANVSGVDFGNSNSFYFKDEEIVYRRLCIESGDLTKASFHGVILERSPILNFSILDYTIWSKVKLNNIRFEGYMKLIGATFSNAELEGTYFGEYTKLDKVTFEPSLKCRFCKFDRTSMLDARLNHSNFYRTKFRSLSMTNSNMSQGIFYGSRFESVELSRVDLSGADLRFCYFKGVSMLDCLIFGANLQGANFSYTNLTGCVGFVDSQLHSNVSLYETTLPNGTHVARKIFTKY